MKSATFALLALIVGVFASDALAQGGCMRGASAGGSLGSMMSPMSGGLNPANYQATLLAQRQLAYQYQLQQTQLQQQLQLEQTELKLQSEQAARKAALRQERLAARRERQESEKARRAAEKATAKAGAASGTRQLVATK